MVVLIAHRPRVRLPQFADRFRALAAFCASGPPTTLAGRAAKIVGGQMVGRKFESAISRWRTAEGVQMRVQMPQLTNNTRQTCRSNDLRNI